MSKKKTQKEVELIYSKKGYKLLSKYINNRTPSKIECPMGHITETITFTGSGISGTTKCDMLYNEEIESDGKEYKLKCFKYGRLGILKVNQY